MRLACLILALQLLVLTAVTADARLRPIQYWNLPTGSHIAFIHYVAQTSRKATPIIFLHGGPGAASTPSSAESAISKRFDTDCMHGD